MCLPMRKEVLIGGMVCSVWVGYPQVAMPRSCPNMTLANNNNNILYCKDDTQNRLTWKIRMMEYFLLYLYHAENIFY